MLVAGMKPANTSSKASPFDQVLLLNFSTRQNSVINSFYPMIGPYLLIITKRKLVGILNGHEIWQAQETDILPFPKNILHLTEDQVIRF